MRILVVWGLGGAGKSQLVLNYVQEYRGLQSGILDRGWIERDDRARLYSNLQPSVWSFNRGRSGDGEGEGCGAGGQALVPGSEGAVVGGAGQRGYGPDY